MSYANDFEKTLTDRERADCGALLTDRSDSSFHPGMPIPTPVLNDPVDHPAHYTQHPSGVECISIIEHMNFCLGNAIKYIWRASLKNGIEDLKKARWYLGREITRLETILRDVERDAQVENTLAEEARRG